MEPRPGGLGRRGLGSRLSGWGGGGDVRVHPCTTRARTPGPTSARGLLQRHCEAQRTACWTQPEDSQRQNLDSLNPGTSLGPQAQENEALHFPGERKWGLRVLRTPRPGLSGPPAGQKTSPSGGKALAVSGIPGVTGGTALDLPGCANRVTQEEGHRDCGPESPLLREGTARGRPVAGGRAGVWVAGPPGPFPPLSAASDADGEDALGFGLTGCAPVPAGLLPTPARGCCQWIYMEQGGHPLPVHSSRSLFEGKIDFRMIVH